MSKGNRKRGQQTPFVPSVDTFSFNGDVGYSSGREEEDIPRKKRY